MKRLSLAALALVSLPVHAHHPLGGAVPATVFDGLASGLAHPVIGIDHLAFIVLVGLAAARAGRPIAGAVAFVGATAAGALLHVGGIVLPLGELVVALSIVVLGVALLPAYRTVAPPVLLAGFGIAGLFHGWAYGEAVVGAEPTPVVAYLAGLALVQLAIAVGAGYAARRAATVAAPLQPSSTSTGARIAAAVCLGVGAVFLFENMETVILGAV